VIWTVPEFTVDRFRGRLRDMHDQIGRDGAFHSTMSRTLFEVRKPATGPVSDAPPQRIGAGGPV